LVVHHTALHMHVGFGFALQQVVRQGIAVQKLIGVSGIRKSTARELSKSSKYSKNERALAYQN